MIAPSPGFKSAGSDSTRLSSTNPELPRQPEEIRRGSATYSAGGCAVKTDGLRLEVSFPGLSLGIFSGSLTIYSL